MMNLNEEDLYLAEQGIDPFGEGTQPQADDDLLQALSAREQFKRKQKEKQQIMNLGGGDMYYEMQQPAPNYKQLEDDLIMELLNEGY